MILSDLLTDSYIAYRGKISNLPVAGSDKYTAMLSIANRKMREWATDSNVDWPSLYQILSSGTVTTGTQAYDLDDSVIRLSDYVYLTNTAGTKKYISVLEPQTISQYMTGCYVSGGNPKQLTFLNTIDASLTGMTLNVPAFVLPDNMTSGSNTVPVDDPQWLVYAVAAELARNDFSKEEQYPNLNGIANDLYRKMVLNAQTNSYLQPASVGNTMPQYTGIGGVFNGGNGYNN